VYEKKALMGQLMDLPENMGKFVLKDYSNDYRFKGQPVGEAFIGMLTPKDGQPVEILLPLRFPELDRMRKGAVSIVVSDYVRRYYTGLQVTKDPGVWVVYTGFIMMIIGCYVTFFMSHQRLCIDIVKKGHKSMVMVAGAANKNKWGMQDKVRRISQNLLRL
jgi:cytochrome c biogenesis protein